MRLLKMHLLFGSYVPCKHLPSDVYVFMYSFLIDDKFSFHCLAHYIIITALKKKPFLPNTNLPAQF